MSIASSIKPNVAAQAGAILLVIPIYFVTASVLRQDAPGLSFFAQPILLLGALLLALTLNAVSILSVNFRSDAPSVLSVSLEMRFWNLAVAAAGLLLLGVLLGYAFVENFQPRPLTN